MLAGVVLDYCRWRLPSLAPGDKIRILEIGSGSGGTSATVMAALTAAASAAAAATEDSTAGSISNPNSGGGGAVAPSLRNIGTLATAAALAGTDSSVSAASLQGLLERLEFVYTDISPQLVAYGRKTYGPQHPYTKFRVLDVERDVDAQASATSCCEHCCPTWTDILRGSCRLLHAFPSDIRRAEQCHLRSQGCEVGTTDIVFATNVLHATCNMGNTLSHSKVINIDLH